MVAGDERAAGRAARGVFAGHPKGLAFLFFAELWERFSYYGMRALLTLFMVAPVTAGGLELSLTDAAVVYGNYTMAVYMLSIPGGFVADRWLGPSRAVMFGGAVIALGHFVLAIHDLSSFYLGLVLVALGTGLFKPSISALVGGLYPANDTRRDAGFSLFYMGINIGGFLAPLVTGFLAQGVLFKGWLGSAGIAPELSWHFGFAAAGVGMVVGLLVYLSGRDVVEAGQQRPVETGDEPFLGRGPWPIAAMIGGTLTLLALTILSDEPGWEWLRAIFVLAPILSIAWFALRPNETSRRLAAIGVFFSAAMVFWAIFEQMGFTIALFADTLTRNEIQGIAFPSSWYQSLNPLFVILLAPLFVMLWTRLGARQPSAPMKFVLALVLLALSSLLMVPAALLTAEGRVSPLWLIGLFALQTAGELCLSPVGLSTMTKLAPIRATGLVLGIWFLGAAFGNKLASLAGSKFTATEPTALMNFFLVQGLVIFALALILLALTPWVKRLMGPIR
ncbi:MAG: peptide MFS transporter [Hyphomicrobium sp.]|nr:peptide MFS transporter [Hyphomicrobium sp.]